MLRMLFSLPFYLIAAWWGNRKEDNVRMTRKQWGYVIALGLLGYYFSSYFDFVGLQYVSAASGGLSFFFFPPFSLFSISRFFINAVARVHRGALFSALT